MIRIIVLGCLLSMKHRHGRGEQDPPGVRPDLSSLDTPCGQVRKDTGVRPRPPAVRYGTRTTTLVGAQINEMIHTVPREYSGVQWKEAQRTVSAPERNIPIQRCSGGQNGSEKIVDY